MLLFGAKMKIVKNIKDFDAERQYSSPCRLQASLTRSAAGMRTVITNHARGVYIIKTEFCISPTQRVVYHQVADECTLKRDDMHLLGDEIHRALRGDVRSEARD